MVGSLFPWNKGLPLCKPSNSLCGGFGSKLPQCHCHGHPSLKVAVGWPLFLVDLLDFFGSGVTSSGTVVSMALFPGGGVIT
jgi:hypothetical protein